MYKLFGDPLFDEEVMKLTLSDLNRIRRKQMKRPFPIISLQQKVFW
jgi:hypothetical protein